MKRIHFFISGFVQKIGFRHGTKSKARELGLTGWVRNTQNGKVEVVAEGPREKLEKLVNWASRGPLLAKVSHVGIEWLSATDEFNGFEIK